MNRETALIFIRENSRPIISMTPDPQAEEPIYFEYRLGDNGTPFILQDMGKNGWHLFFSSGSSLVPVAIKMFCEKTGVINWETKLNDHGEQNSKNENW